MKDIDLRPSKKKTVIYAWTYVGWGGAEIYTLALIREARKRYDVTAVIPRGSSSELLRFLDQADVKYEFFEPAGDFDPALTIRRKLQRHLRKLTSEASLVRYLLKKDLENSVVHIAFTPQQSFISLFRLCRHTHVFFTMHNAVQSLPHWRELIWAAKIRLLFRTGKFNIFSANENAKEYLSRFVSESAASNITVTRAGIDPNAVERVLENKFDRNAALKRFDLATDKTIVLTVGQFIDRKGRWTYLETIRNIVAKRKDLQFVWLMPNLPNSMDRARVEEHELGKDFKMILSENVGTSRTEILEFFRIADIYVLPSFVEGIPISLLEAMALGLPSVSTRINGIPEAIESGKTGLLVDPGDVVGLEKAITQLADDPVLLKKIAVAGQAFVLSEFDERVGAEIALIQYRRFLG